ncbi:MAG: efflux RND transporter periplasmic adaptor subunit, partial [Rhodobacteraceae bacterium]|nr:efflux RND transporter periplasmic adaptor subunit [Paracoccaceae bacterium]
MLIDKVLGVFPTVLVASLLCASSVFTGPASAEQPLLVESVQAEMEADQQILSLIGEIVAREEVGLSFPMGGRILSISVRKGDKIAKGQELARLESVQQKQALLGVEAALEAAQADLFQAKEEFEREDTFLDRGATTRIRRDESERRFRIAQANVERATAELKQAQKTHDDTFLYASAAGIVIDRLADPGEVVTGARPILKLALGKALDAIFDAPEAMPVTDSAGPKIGLVLLDKPGITFTGSVRKVSPLVDPQKGTVEVTLGIDQPPEEANYGDAVRGIFQVVGPPRIILPYSVLTAVGQTPAVWVIDPETHVVNLSPINIARYTDGHVIIDGGINPGERVVTTGTQLLYPGRIVRL